MFIFLRKNQKNFKRIMTIMTMDKLLFCIRGIIYLFFALMLLLFIFIGSVLLLYLGPITQVFYFILFLSLNGICIFYSKKQEKLFNKYVVQQFFTGLLPFCSIMFGAAATVNDNGGHFTLAKNWIILSGLFAFLIVLPITINLISHTFFKRKTKM